MRAMWGIGWLALALVLVVARPAVAQGVAKPVVAVESVKGGSGEVPNLRTMIETAIISSGRFTVMSAGQVVALEKSESLCAAGTIWRGGKCVKGRITVPDYRISATVTSAGVARANEINLITIISKDDHPPCISLEPYLSLDIRVISTGEQIQGGESFTLKGTKAKSCDGREPSTASSFDALMRQVANRVSQKLVLTSYPIEVVDIQPGNKLMLTYGEDVLAMAQQVDISRKGPAIRDSMGRQFTKTIDIGTAQIVSLTPTTSIAVLLCTKGGAGAQVGDIARLSATKVRPQRPAKGTTIPGACR